MAETSAEAELTHPFNVKQAGWAKGMPDAWALSSESSVAVEYLAALASGETRSYAELMSAVEQRDLRGIDPHWLARLARVAVLQADTPKSRRFATAALRLSIPLLPQDGSTLSVRKLLVELLFQAREITEAQTFLSQDSALGSLYHGYLQADLLNPFVTHHADSFSRWLELFNAPLSHYGIASIEVDARASHPFNTMQPAILPPRVEGEPLVSVVLTSFNPNATDFTVALESILQQSWQNLEILIVDDCSTEVDLMWLDEIAAGDPRIRLLRLSKNGGTYRARNVGITEARGEFITGQDADDWSHPERIARQVAAFVERPDSCGVMTSANRTDDNLVRIALGINPHRRCEVSLMYRRRDAQAIGGYLPVRKGADSEFRERLEVWSGRPVVALEEPLYIIRMTPGSLSRADFRAGWSHQARRAFWSGYKHWHQTSKGNELQLSALEGNDDLPFPPPHRMLGSAGQRPHYDLCFVADWRLPTPLVRAAIDEINAATRAGIRVSVLQMESPFSRLGASRSLTPNLQALINAGTVARAFHEEAADVDLMIVRDPAVVDYGKAARSEIDARHCVVVANGSPDTAPSAVRTYIPHHAHALAQTIFETDVRWAVPAGASLDSFQRAFGALPGLKTRYPLVVDLAHFSRSKPRRRSPLVKFGRASSNSLFEWPSDPREIEVAYPLDGSVDVRVLGDARAAVRILGRRSLPPAWLDFRDDAIRPDVFWRSLDFVVQFDRLGDGGYRRGIVEAMASGTVIIAPSSYDEAYPNAVLSAQPDEVTSLANEYEPSTELYRTQADSGRAFVESALADEPFVRFVSNLI